MKSRSIRTVIIAAALVLACIPAQGAVRFKLGLAANYFAVSDPNYERVYGSGGAAIGASVALQVSKVFEIRAEIGAFNDKGAMTVSGADLSLSLRPLVLSVRATPLQLGRFRPFIGVGIGTMSIKEDYPDPISDYSETANLSMFEAGVYFGLTERVHIAAGLRFTSAKATSPYLDQTIDLGGMRPGLEISYMF